MSDTDWTAAHKIASVRYTCGYCDSLVASDQGWRSWNHEANDSGDELIVICPHCNRPTYFEPPDEQTPSVAFGNPVSKIPDQPVHALYDEARRATSAECFTATVLCCRKLLMHVAVEKGATPGSSFLSYVEHLLAANYLPPDARDWLDYIRKRSNEANHEITLMSREDAEVLVTFAEMLLKVIYEFPAKVKGRVAP